MSGSIMRGLRAHLALALSVTLLCASCILATPSYADQKSNLSEKITSAYAASKAAATAVDFKDEDRAGDFYFAQSGSGRCTISSISMMIRRAAYLAGNAEWEIVDEASVSASGWCAAGVKNEFESAGYDIEFIGIAGTHESLEQLLSQHPEGVAIYDPGVPHAVLLTDYDQSSDTFYCADPATFYSGKRIPLSESWNGERHGHSQDATIAGFSSAWVIS